MRLVVDTSIIISSLMKDSESRRLMLLPDLDLFTPEYVHVEIERHAGKIMEYTGLSDNEYNLLMGHLLSHVNVIPLDDFKEHLGRAYTVMKDIDPEDTAFLALALALDCDGIWSNDSDYEKQTMVKVYKTHILKTYLKNRLH